MNRTNPYRIISKVNKANAQSAQRRILLSMDNGKLYFECLKIFSVPENHLPLMLYVRGQKRFRSLRF
ncbi:hypothetical protein EZS27_004040 [termite gut metagenome]|uniref:Uncharacterized protein n=1 Tax=termite gut metagenome TaxID=433724 RepID=A0A5J4SR02_9ZZZZ